MALDPQAFSSLLNFAPLTQSITGFRNGIDANADYRAQQNVGSRIASGDWQGAQAAAGQGGMDPQVLISLNNQRLQADEMERQKAALAKVSTDPNYLKLPEPQRMALDVLSPADRAKSLNSEFSSAGQADVALKRAEASKAYAQGNAATAAAANEQWAMGPTGDLYSKRTGDLKQPADGGQVKQLADAIEQGMRPPTLTNMPKGVASSVGAELQRRGVNVTKAQLEYDSAHKQIQALNGPQMVRYAGLSKSVINTIDEVNSLAGEMANSGFTGLNAAKLAVLINTQGNTKQGQLATRYIAAVNTLKEEFANLAQGGYAPTEAAWHLANQQINSNYGVDQMNAGLKEVQRLIRYRLEGIPNFTTMGPDAANRYTGNPGTQQQGHGAPQPQQAAPSQQQGIHPGAVDMLRKNPGMAQQFDQKYGQGAAAKILGGGQ